MSTKTKPKSPTKASKTPAKKKAPASPKTSKTSKKKPAAKAKPRAPSVRPAKAEDAKAKAPKNLSDVKLLVVDDEPEVLNLLVPFLKSKGYSVSEAEDGDEALEKILTERPNIVLLDVMMPGLSGWEISRYVRDRSELDPVRIIMATGIGEEVNAATAPIHGADAYIDKPFRLDEVEKTVQDVLSRIQSGAI